MQSSLANQAINFIMFLRTAVMIALIKYIIYEGCDHDQSPHKNITFLSLYRIAIMIAVFVIKVANMIAVFTKMFYI